MDVEKIPIVLTIGGFDSSSGAGITRDIAVINHLGCYGVSVVTNLTIQNSIQVFEVIPVEPVNVMAQLKAIEMDFHLNAIKIGMLGNEEIIEGVTEWISNQKCNNIVIDPVMYASSGHTLLEERAISQLKELISQATLVTPNTSEAKVLYPRYNNQITFLAEEKDPKGILFKGGHSEGEPIDRLYIKVDNQYHFKAAYPGIRFPNKSVHGTGCSFASLIASQLALGNPLEEAIKESKKIISHWIENANKLGRGRDLIMGDLKNNFLGTQKGRL